MACGLDNAAVSWQCFSGCGQRAVLGNCRKHLHQWGGGIGRRNSTIPSVAFSGENFSIPAFGKTSLPVSLVPGNVVVGPNEYGRTLLVKQKPCFCSLAHSTYLAAHAQPEAFSLNCLIIPCAPCARGWRGRLSAGMVDKAEQLLFYVELHKRNSIAVVCLSLKMPVDHHNENLKEGTDRSPKACSSVSLLFFRGETYSFRNERW